MSEPPLLCWVVTDGRRGIENQALGLAEAVGRRIPLTIERRVAPRPPLVRLAPPKLGDLRSPPPGGEGAGGGGPTSNPGPSPAKAHTLSAPPPLPLPHKGGGVEEPALWIGCGRASLPYSERAHGWFPAAFVVQLQDPKRPLAPFDLMIPPRHDELEGPNVFAILGSPNRIDAARLAEARAPFEPTAPPSPRAAVLIGGGSKRHRLGKTALATLTEALAAARTQGWSLLITTSRRTPQAAVATLRARFADDPGVRLWSSDADGPNPYLGFLAAADLVLVTKDSTNMITEAASAGKPVLLLDMEGADGKLAALYAALEARGNAKPYAGALAPWPVEPLAETERAAAEVVRRLGARVAPG